MKFSNRLLQLQGRVLPQEKILQATGFVSVLTHVYLDHRWLWWKYEGSNICSVVNACFFQTPALLTPAFATFCIWCPTSSSCNII